ncbi:MAG: radical SAM protein [Deltaproteobacteria bacterium]|nr:radical SAM protein [Deltaproteobacteria bacterium]
MKIKLIDPAFKGDHLEQDARDIKAYWFARLSLSTIAALTPEHHQVKITDENVEEIDFDEDVDLLGLTGMTMHAPRAYAIADRFRQRGIPVVMGGIHASSIPQEALQHVDAVVVGEAEMVWEQLLQDVQRGELKPIYKADKVCSMKNMRHPRRDLLNREAYSTVNCVQASRGCPFACEYCTVSQFFGRTYRYRPVDEIVEEVRSLEGDVLMFVDDNLVGKPAMARELFQKLIPLNKKWGSQGSLTMAKDRELLRLMSKSGNYAMFIGFESLSPDALAAMNKSWIQVEEFEDNIKIIQDHGIMIIGSFIFGLDQDDEGVFERTVRFCEKTGIELPIFFILTPIVGTPLFKRLESEGRILHRQWEKYNGGNVVFQPKLMSEDTLQEGYNWGYHEIYSRLSMFKRIVLNPFPLNRLVPNLGLNLAFRRMVMRAPNGTITELSRILHKLNISLPVKNPKNLIPTLADISMERGQKLWQEASREYLRIRATSDQRFRSLVIRLEGSMDLQAARTFMSRMMLAIQTGLPRVVIDFKGITHLSPRAIQHLVSEIYDWIANSPCNVQFINLKDKLARMPSNAVNLLGRIEMFEDDEANTRLVDK